MQTDSHNIRKRFSQNFLKDQNVIEKIVSIINPQKNDYIVEIGPGKGWSGLAKRSLRGVTTNQISNASDLGY